MGWFESAVYSNATVSQDLIAPKKGRSSHIPAFVCKLCLQIIPDWLVKMPTAMAGQKRGGESKGAQAWGLRQGPSGEKEEKEGHCHGVVGLVSTWPEGLME